MADYFENGVFGGNIPAWHGLGTVVEDDVLTAEQVIEYVPELGYDVEMVPLVVPWNGQQLQSDVFATVRSDGKVLGAGMTEKYMVVQNRDAFSFIDTLVDDGEAKYHTAGTLKDGKDAWMLARLSKDLLIGGIESERIQQFLLASNNFNRGHSFIVKLVRTRVVCANTLDVALGESGREIRIRHITGESGQSLDGKIEEARRVLEIAFDSGMEFEAVANGMLNTKLSDVAFQSFMERLIPLAPDANPDKDRAAKNRVEARDAVKAIYKNADNLANVRGTAWAAYNAVAEYFDHVKGGKDGEARMTRITSDYRMKDEALALLTR